MQEDLPLVLSAARPSSRETWLALCIAGLLAIAFDGTAPFTNVHLAPVSAFVPMVDTIQLVTDSITAALLLAQFSVLGSRSLVALASGYLFTSWVVIAHALNFPGAFSPTGLLGAGLQTSAYLYVLGHFGLPISAIAFGLMKGGELTTQSRRGSVPVSIVASILGTLAIASTLVWLVIAKESWLPPVMSNVHTVNSNWPPLVAPIALNLSALALLWRFRRSVLGLWVLVALWSQMIELLLLGTTTERFTLVWYSSRVFAVLSASIVLVALLAQVAVLQTRLATAVLKQRRERDNRLMAIDATLAAVAHEIKQPLTAIVTNGSAGLTLLDRGEMPAADVREILRDMVADGYRASDIANSIRAMFNEEPGELAEVDLATIVEDVLRLTKAELQHHAISVERAFGASVRRVAANRIQLQQVLLNLALNAIDAMDSVTARRRVLRIHLEEAGPDVVLTLEDSGPGIASANLERVFDPFYTTKSSGVGLGLWICRSIVEAHGGRLWARRGEANGAVFQISLPALPVGGVRGVEPHGEPAVRGNAHNPGTR